MPNIRLKRYNGVAWEDVEVRTDWSQILNKPSTFTPTAHTHNGSDITSGKIDPERLGSGQRTATTFLNGLGNWATVSGGDADTLDGYHETAFVRLSANSSSPTNGAFAIGNASSRNFIQSHNGQPLDINPLGNNVILNSGGGSVGIGTTSPANKLHIQDGDLRIFNTGSANPSIFLSNYNVSTTYPQVALIQSDAGVYGGNFSIQTKPNGASTNALSTRLYVQHDGNIGIGTTSPEAKLHVAGDAAINNTTLGVRFNTSSYGGNTAGLSLNSVAEIRSPQVFLSPALTFHYENLATRHILMNASGTINVVSPSTENSGVAVLAVNGNRVWHNGNLTFSLSGSTLTITTT
jgi:hypothetical protein